MLSEVCLVNSAMLLLLISILSVTGAFAVAASSDSRPHPLDPLSAAELTAVSAAVFATPFVTARPLTIHYVGLDEPEKADVIAYAYSTSSSSSSGPAVLPRRALVIARAGGQSHELRVDVTNASAKSVISHSVHRGSGFPRFTTGEIIAAAKLPRAYSVRRRGLNLSEISCGVFSKGWFGSREEARWRGARVAKIQCFVKNAATANAYTRPLEGVVLGVDIERMAVVGYRDRVVRPVPKAEGTEYWADKVRPPFTGPANVPGVVVQPEGKGFQIDGQVV
ncbi:hypothetical protein EJB05_51662, partial [Eragrostis curvula]